MSMFRDFFARLRRLFRNYRRNQCILLAGAVAYNTLLSLVPLFALLLVGLSYVVDQRLLLHTVAYNLEFLVPGQAPSITVQVEAFLRHRDLIGVIGVAALLFFSTVAFSILENAMAMIFHNRVGARRRHFAVSVLMPYVFVMALGIGLLLVTLVTGVLEGIAQRSVHILGRVWPLARLSRTLLHVIGTTGSGLMLTALYLVLPVRRVSLRHALIGAGAATALWEIARHLLVWYFAKLSMVNLVYGSLATTVILLLTLEVAALILLFGAQLIAELMSVDAGPAGDGAALSAVVRGS